MPIYDFFKNFFGDKHVDEEMNIHVHLHIDKDVKIILDGNLTIHGDGLQIQQNTTGNEDSRNGSVVQGIPTADPIEQDFSKEEEEEIKEFHFNLGESDISIPNVEFGEDVKD